MDNVHNRNARLKSSKIFGESPKLDSSDLAQVAKRQKFRRKRQPELPTRKFADKFYSFQSTHHAPNKAKNLDNLKFEIEFKRNI